MRDDDRLASENNGHAKGGGILASDIMRHRD